MSIAGVFDWRMALLAAAFLPFTVMVFLLVYRNALQTHESTYSHVVAVAQSGGALDFMRLPAVWMCFGFFFMIAMALGGIQSFSSAGLRDLYGMSLAWATAAYTVYMLASACGMLWGGFIAAKTNQHDRTITIAFSFAGALSLILASGWVTPVLAVILMGFIGFGSGVAGPSRDLLIRAAAPKNATGRVYGIVYSGLDIGLACAPLLFGAIMDRKHPSWVFICIGVFQVLAIVTAVNVGVKTRAQSLAA